MKIKKHILVIICIVTTALLSSCSWFESEIVQDPNVLDSQQYVPETVYIGSILPLSGKDAAEAESAKAAQQLACEIINMAYENIDWSFARNQGITNYGNAQIKLIFADSSPAVNIPANEIGMADSAAAILNTEGMPVVYGENPTTAANYLLNLGAVSLLGAYNSSDTAKAAVRAAQNQIPMVSGQADLAMLTDGQTYQFDNWFNRIGATTAQESTLFFNYLKQLNISGAAQITNVALVYEETTYGKEILASFDAAAEAAGFRVCAHIPYAPGLKNGAELARRVISSEADVVMHAGSSTDLLLLAKAYAGAEYTPVAALVYDGKFMDADFIKEISMMNVGYWGGCCEYPIREADEIVSDELRIFQSLNDLYLARTGIYLSNDALYEFAAVIVIAQAISLSGTTDGEVLAQTMRENTFEMPFMAAGQIQFDENGQNIYAASSIALIQNGSLYKAY